MKKKFVFALSIILMVLMILQVGFMFLPYIQMQGTITTKDANPGPQIYSLFDFCFNSTKTMFSQFKTEFGKDWDINAHVTGFVLVFAFALLNFFSSMFSRKGVVTHLFALGYSYFALTTFTVNPFLELCDYPGINKASLIVAIIATVVIVARIVLWVIARYVTKDYAITQDGFNELDTPKNASWKLMPQGALMTMILVPMLFFILATAMLLTNSYNVKNATIKAEYKQELINGYEQTIAEQNKTIKGLEGTIKDLEEAATEETVAEETTTEETVAEETVEETVAETVAETVEETTTPAA